MMNQTEAWRMPMAAVLKSLRLRRQ